MCNLVRVQTYWKGTRLESEMFMCGKVVFGISVQNTRNVYKPNYSYLFNSSILTIPNRQSIHFLLRKVKRIEQLIQPFSELLQALSS